MANPTLKAAIAARELILAPGIYDLISAKIADEAGFQALYVTGYGTVASHLGLPDAGIATYSDMLSRVALMAARCQTPIIADADTGYGGLLNVHHTVRGYEDAGVTAIQIEDQEFPKKCGHTPARRVVPLKEMLRKIEVAVNARRSDDFLVIARTDARSGLGLDEAIARGKAFAEAGADIVFVESPETRDEMRRIADSIDAPLLANLVHGGRTPLLSEAELRDYGFAVAIYPALGFLSAGAALRAAYGDLRRNGQTGPGIAMHDFPDFSRLMGFEEVWAFEKKYVEV